jgi:hypothetical protein
MERRSDIATTPIYNRVARWAILMIAGGESTIDGPGDFDDSGINYKRYLVGIKGLGQTVKPEMGQAYDQWCNDYPAR